jgi:protein SCO1/2
VGDLRRVGWGVTAVLGVVALVLGVAFARSGGSGGDDDGGPKETTADGWHGAELSEAQPRPSFTLTDTAGRPFDFRAQTQGKLTLLFFGYTNCPDACPLQMTTLASALAAPKMPKPVVVFVTTDPKRDTPAHLREWLDGYDASFVGLTGTVDQIHAAEKAALVEPSMFADSAGQPIPEPPADGFYDVGHAAQILTYGPDDEGRIVYPAGVDRDDWVADLPRLAKA